jgi:hypothetical protein
LIELLCVVAMIAILACIAVPNFLDAQVRAKIAVTIDHMHVLSGALEAYWIDNRAYPPNVIDTVVTRAYKPYEEPVQLPDPDAVWWHRIELAGDRWLCETSASMVLRAGRSLRPNAYDSPLAFNGTALIRLTTPIPYIGRLPQDLFFSYWTGWGVLYRPPAIVGSIDPVLPPTWALDTMRPLGYFNFTAVEPDGLLVPGFGRTTSYLLVSPGPDVRVSLTDVTQPFPAIYDPTNGTVSSGDMVLTDGS